ncbi:aldose epimerase family protein [Limibacter armeniacum]|uniref:aldose epimerase family protein n=1 Tax=Limibacter armeniacum TaxID=466084 RepID=UPI002FE515C7
MLKTVKNITKHTFGYLDGERIDAYTLTNRNGMKVQVINYGATITSIRIPDGSPHQQQEVVCGFDTLEGYQSEAYKANAPYFGCTVGRFASRIKDGKFSVNGTAYEVACNDSSNHLHGGLNAFDKRIWAAEMQEDTVVMKLFSPHLEEGFPANVEVSVSFRLSDENELVISYEATADQETPLSLTNHTYFNLSGFERTVESTVASIKADSYLMPDDTNVPVGEVKSVQNDPADLRTPRQLGDAFRELPTGFEHYFVFDNRNEAAPVAEFSDEATGRSLQVYTTEPGMLFYTGYFTDDKLKRESGNQYGRFKGFCCETHRYPNGPNIEGAPDVMTGPDNPYQSRTVFRFGFETTQN